MSKSSPSANMDVITSPFGPRAVNGYQIHYGMDVRGDVGDDAGSPTFATVVDIEDAQGSTGWVLTLEFENDETNQDEYILYFHSNSDPANYWGIGDNVNPGFAVYEVGDGNGFFPSHLHMSYIPEEYFSPGFGEVFDNYKLVNSNPVGLFNHPRPDYLIQNYRVEQDPSTLEAKLKFDIHVDPRRVDLNYVGVSFSAGVVNGTNASSFFPVEGNDPIIKIGSTLVSDYIHNTQYSYSQFHATVDFDDKIGYDFGDRNNSNGNDSYFNGVEISVPGYSSSLQGNDFVYSFAFDLEKSMLEKLIGGFQDLKIVMKNSDNDIQSETITINAQQQTMNEVSWVEKWPHDTNFLHAPSDIHLIDDGKILILNQGSSKTDAVTLPSSATIRVKDGGKFETEDGADRWSRTYFYSEGDFYVDDGGQIELGDNSWFTVDGGYFEASGGSLDPIVGSASEFFGINNGRYRFKKFLSLSSPETCIAIDSSSSVTFEDGASFSNGSFLASFGTSGSGEINIGENITLSGPGNDDGYVLNLAPGTTLNIGYNKKITIADGSKMRSIGTLSDPVTFTYDGTYDPTSDAWDGIELRGDGNIFEYTILEHAITPLYVRSDNNVVEYSTIRNNASYGIKTESDYSGGRSSLTITDSNIHDNDGHGVYLRNTNAGIQYTNIEDNNWDGVYVYNSTIGNPNQSGSEYFRSNYISGNGSSAIELAYNTTVYDGYSSTNGNNDIAHNGSHEVYLSSSSARWYDANGGSYTAVSQYQGSSDKYVYNLAQTTSGESTVSWTVGMENNAWSYTNPSSSFFYGPVDYNPYQTGQMFGSSGPRGSTPSEMNGGELPQMVLSSAAVEAQTSGMNSSSEKDAYLEQTREINKLMATINGNPRSRMVAKNLNGLIGYYNQLPEGKKSEFDQVPNMLRGFISDRQLAREVSFGMDGSRLTSETALMLQTHQALQDGDAQEALNEINKYESTFSNLDIKREIGFVKANALEQLGRYDEAIAVYNELAILSRLGIDSDNTTTDYKTLISTMEDLKKEKNGEETSTLNIQVADKVKENPNTEEALPTSFVLNKAYPNPFNPSTTFSFDMPETGVVKVEVFDITGRMVSVLTNKRYEAGRHNLQFNAEGLASGVYLVRANLAGTIQSQKVTLIK